MMGAPLLSDSGFRPVECFLSGQVGIGYLIGRSMLLASNLIRSLVFWAGLPVMVFISWTWIDSQYRSLSWQYSLSPRHFIFIQNSEASIHFQDSWISPGASFTSTGKWGSLRIQRFPERSRDSLRTAGFRREYRPGSAPIAVARGIGIDRLIVNIPHWLIFSVAGLIWMLLSLWRANKIGKFRAGAGGPLPETLP